MVSLTEPVARMVVHPDTAKVLATVSPEGEPHMIVCGSLTLDGDDTIVLGEVFMYRAAENLRRCPKAEFLVWKGKSAFSIKATARERLTSGPLFDRMSASLSHFNMETVAVWTFGIDEVWDESASDSAGERLI